MSRSRQDFAGAGLAANRAGRTASRVPGLLSGLLFLGALGALVENFFIPLREVLKIQFLTEGNQENKEDGRENNVFKFIYFKCVIKNKAFRFSWFSSFPSLPSVQFLEVPSRERRIRY
jgi:hypothetical protein